MVVPREAGTKQRPFQSGRGGKKEDIFSWLLTWPKSFQWFTMFDGTWPLTFLAVSLSSLSPHDTVPALLASMLFPHIPSASLLLVNFLLDVRPITVYSILKSSHLNILKLLGIRLTL